MRKLLAIVTLCAVLCVCARERKRRITPLDTPATAKQAVNETAGDTARMIAKRLAQSVSFVDDRGKTVYLDTITGEEWADSSVVNRVPKMEMPLWHAATIGVNVFDPFMRAVGQNYGLGSVWAELSLHNRYRPYVEVWLGSAKHLGPNGNYVYRSSAAPFFKFGINYNFLYNSNPAYSLYAGLHYGISSFSFAVDDVIVDDPYWGEYSKFNIPSQRASAGWIEFGLGLRVNLWGPISAGWEVRYHSLMHQSKPPYGKPWYIPGYGTCGSSLAVSVSVSYTISLSHLNKAATEKILEEQNDNQVEGLLPPPGE